MKTILSLFDYSGNWSKPYRENGYKVIQVDIKLGLDIYELDYQNLPDIYGVLAAVPCTDFAASGARWFNEKDKDGRTAESIKLLKHTLKIIQFLEPVFWAIENPVGRMNSLVPEMKQYGPWYFQPHHYGEPYTKKTGLWGRFVPPLPIFARQAWQPVEPTEGSKMHMLPPSPDRAELRSITPIGFAYAFYEANK